ncbi:hypothetical protein MTR67_052601 [Solanum verrucosum]|uniref:Uncharacterized protein n=1 Tax=Solanum verrucosum TaxID=315347 RepID=A0AAF0V9J9_SOLVR|nr:hypothetical protein MTR67_052601 [Solanum verrucosum]
MDVIMSMPKDKATTVDGFPIEIFTENWELVKGEIVHVVQKFFCIGIHFPAINAIDITLIPNFPSPFMRFSKDLMLQANLDKSSLYIVGVGDHTKEELFEKLGYVEVTFANTGGVRDHGGQEVHIIYAPSSQTQRVEATPLFANVAPSSQTWRPNFVSPKAISNERNTIMRKRYGGSFWVRGDLYTDHRCLSYIISQNDLNLRQWRWIDLSLYSFPSMQREWCSRRLELEGGDYG